MADFLRKWIKLCVRVFLIMYDCQSIPPSHFNIRVHLLELRLHYDSLRITLWLSTPQDELQAHMIPVMMYTCDMLNTHWSLVLPMTLCITLLFLSVNDMEGSNLLVCDLSLLAESHYQQWNVHFCNTICWLGF